MEKIIKEMNLNVSQAATCNKDLLLESIAHLKMNISRLSPCLYSSVCAMIDWKKYVKTSIDVSKFNPRMGKRLQEEWLPPT
jgi:site-specific recombinase